MGAGETGGELGQGIAAAGFGAHLAGHRHPQGVAQQREIRFGGQAFLTGHHYGYQAGRRRIGQGKLASKFQLRGGQGPQAAGQIHQLRDIPGPVTVGGVLQLRPETLDDDGVQQLPQIQRSEHRGQQGRVEGQRLGPPLRDRQVPLVHESARVTVEHAGRERAGGGRDHLD